MIVRRIVLILLLITVPFQAAVGSTGLVCGHGAHDAALDAASAHSAQALAHHHDQNAHRHADSHVAAETARTGDIGNDAGSCSLCSECSFSATPVSQSSVTVASPSTPLKISAYVDPAALRDGGDGLFRPPRTIRS